MTRLSITHEDMLRAISLPGWGWSEGMVLHTGEDTPQLVLLTTSPSLREACLLRSDMQIIRGHTEGRTAPCVDHPSNTGHLVRMLGDRVQFIQPAGESALWMAEIRCGEYEEGTLAECCVAVALSIGAWPGGVYPPIESTA